MAVSWRILSPISPRAMLEVERECEAALEEYLAEHPKADGWGEFSASGSVPRRQEVEAEYQRLQLELPHRVRQRLAACRSVMEINAPGNLESSPLQVSLLRFILERVENGLMMFNDYPLEETESVRESLRHHRGAAGFPERKVRQPSPTGEPEPPPSEVRALRILEVVRQAEGNLDLAVDVRVALGRVSPLARRYLGLLYEQGVVDDLKASRLLAVSPDELEHAINSLERALREVAPG